MLWKQILSHYQNIYGLNNTMSWILTQIKFFENKTHLICMPSINKKVGDITFRETSKSFFKQLFHDPLMFIS